MTTAAAKKITRTTFKSFIKKNAGKLVIRVGSKFNSMTDGCESTGIKEFSPVAATERCVDHTFGIEGVWFVLGGRDYLSAYSDETHEGITVANCCGRFTIAVAK